MKIYEIGTPPRKGGARHRIRLYLQCLVCATIGGGEVGKLEVFVECFCVDGFGEDVCGIIGAGDFV